MNDQRDRLFKAWGEALSRTTPELDPRVRQRVLAAQARQARPSAFPPAYRWALAAFALAVSLAVLLLVPKAAPSSFQVAGQTGAVGAWLTAEPTRSLPLRFSEGTQVSLSKNSRGRVTGVTRGGAHIELASGSVDAEVAHLPGASWSFGAGPFEVEVTGTHLGVSWAPDSGKFELSVTSGSVLVKGPFIEGLQAVQAGQICRVDLARRLMELGPIMVGQSTPTASGPPLSAAPSAASSAEPAATGAAPASSSSAVAQAATADSLLEAARAARLAGRPAEERAALLACRKRAPGQPAAAQAAYLLGRASSAGEAAQWFEIYLREQPQGLLAREAAGRLIESYRASGKTSAAQTAASRYLARYPNGPHASLARQTLAARGGSQD